MRILIILLSLFALSTGAQNLPVKLIYETKSEYADAIRVIKSDSSGLYILKPSYPRPSLVKLDNNGKLLFERDYSLLVGDKHFSGMIAYREGLFCLAKQHNEKANQVSIYGAWINNSDGNLEKDWKLIKQITLPSKRADYRLGLQNPDIFGDASILCGFRSENTGSYSYIPIDKKISLDSIIELTINISPNAGISDLRITRNGRLILHGMKQEKLKRGSFPYFFAESYDKSGKKVCDFESLPDNKILSQYHMQEVQDGSMLVIGLYKNEVTGDQNGVAAVWFDVLSGKIIKSEFTALSKGSLPFKNSGKSDKNESIFAKNFWVKKIEYDKNEQTYFIMVEETYSIAGGSQNYSSASFIDKDLFIIRLDAGTGKMAWITKIPKDQGEKVGGFFGAGSYVGAHAVSYSYPFHGSFTSSIVNNNLVLLINDNASNKNIDKPDGKPDEIFRYDKSHLFAITVDLKNGNYTRQFVFDHKTIDEIMLPRFATIHGKSFFVLAQRLRLLKPSDYKIFKIDLN